MYLLKLALRPWRIAPFSQVFSALAVGVLLLIASFLIWMERGLKPVVARLQAEQVITAYLSADVEAKDEGVVLAQVRSAALGEVAPEAPAPLANGDSLRVNVGARPVDAPEFRLVGPREFVGDLKGHYPELARELEDLGHEMQTVVPRYVTAAGVFPQGAIERVQAVRGIDAADTSRDRYTHIVGAFRAIRWVARLLVAGLALALITGMLHLSKMNTYLHRDAIALLKLLGGGAWALRAPAALSGLWVGLLGGLVACIGWLYGASWLAGQVRSLSAMMKEIAMPSPILGLALLVSGALIGLASGLGRHELERL